MTHEEREKYLRQKVDIVFIRSCKARLNDDEKAKDYAAGAVANGTRRHVNELISLGKAVEKDSPEHEKFVSDEAKKAEAAKLRAPSQLSTSEALAALAAQIAEQTKAINALVAESGKKGK